ncbi:transposase [Sphingomonas sp.]|uniref:transposase n=2 Tax=Pseudomonadota TaxID=1224 RepID=UPI0010F9DC11
MGEPKRRCDRSVGNGAIWVSATGGRWKDMPGRYGDAGACCSRYRLWKREGTPETIAMVLAGARQRQDG